MAETPDLGRVAVVSLFALSTLSAAGRAWTAATSGGPPAAATLEIACSASTGAFCVLVVAAYLRRGAALATDRSWRVRLAAPAATCLPLVVPVLPVSPAPPAGGALRPLIGLVLVLAGTTWCLWAVSHLSRCLSVVPQARGLVASGPYRLVRHPLYLGEVVAMSGAAVHGGHWSQAAVVLALLALQLYRARREEALLMAAVPGYTAYAARTWRIVPGLA
jgi:protein-S-isoprenylcysteine O-methyltransferase Ste14